MTAVALHGDDPLDVGTRAALYLDDRNAPPACGFEYTFDYGRRLTTAYKAVFRRMLKAEPYLPNGHRPRAQSLRYMRSAVRRLAYYHRVVFPLGLFDRTRFDVFHCPHWIVPPADRTRRVPRVFTVYDLIPIVRPEFVDPPHAEYFEQLLSRIDIERDWVVCISEFTRMEFCERTGMSLDRVKVAPLAAEDFFRPVTDSDLIASTRARYGIPEGEYFLCLAAPQPRKNLAHLIHSFFRLLDEQQLPDTTLVLAGSKGQGWMYDEIFAAAASSERHRSRFIFTDFVAEEDLAPLYSGAVAFVYPSLYEGFGLPALEAMACGTPVITSNTTSLPEVAGDAAVLVSPTDPDELCDAMTTVLLDQSLRGELRARGRARATQFSWKRCADITAEVYHLAAAEAREQRVRRGDATGAVLETLQPAPQSTRH
jgi:glycosyltransferase involved in cell wall biosynthesis